MYELKLLKTVQSEDWSARLAILVTIHSFAMDLLCDVVQATFLCSYCLYTQKKPPNYEVTATLFEKHSEIAGYQFQN